MLLLSIKLQYININVLYLLALTGTWYMVHGTQYTLQCSVLDTQYTVHGTQYSVHTAQDSAHACLLQVVEDMPGIDTQECHGRIYSWSLRDEVAESLMLL